VERLRGSALLSPLLRVGVPILAVTLLTLYVAHAHSAGQPTIYEANAELVLSSSSNFDPIGGQFGSQDDRYVQNQAEIIQTLDVLNLAAAALAAAQPPDPITGPDLRSRVTAVPRGASDVLTITAQAGDPAVAAKRADAVAAAYAQFTAAHVSAIANQAATASAADPVMVQTIRARQATYGDGVSVIQQASVPSGPASPTPKRDALLAAGAVFLLACGLAAAWLRRRKPAGPDRLAEDVGGPLIGEVPVRWFGTAAVPQQPGRAVYGMALQALRYRMRESGEPSVLLTTAGADAGATSALLGLAGAEAAQGRNVVVVDATPDGRLLRRAGVPVPAVALTTVVAGGADLDQALATVRALAGPNGGSVRAARVERSSADVLRKSLATLHASADLVLVDAGSATENPAAFALLDQVGTVVAVVRARRRTKALGELRRRLALAGRACDGVLVTHRRWMPPVGLPSPLPPEPQGESAVQRPPATA
jgi:capsular polysaccharide biosynthesis protein